MADGFIQIKRSLLNHPCVVKAPVAQRWVLITIANHCCFRPTKIDDHGVLIDLDVGEFLCTVRELAKLANVEKNDVDRALKRFSNNLLVRQGVRHKKTVVSISTEYIVEYETRSETRSETSFYETKNEKVRQEVRQEVRQSRDTNEERKNEIPFVKKETNKERKVVRPAFRSSLLHEEDIAAMVAMTQAKDRSIPQQDFVQWVKHHEVEEIVFVIGKMLDQKNIKKSPAAWVQSQLSSGLYSKCKREEINRSFAEELKNKYNISSLKITKEYARDQNTGYDFQFWWEVDMFSRTIKEKFNIKDVNQNLL